jgi:hypothetical protein
MSEELKNGSKSFFCSVCGKEIEENCVVCPYCGAAFDEQTEFQSDLTLLKKKPGFKNSDIKILLSLSGVFLLALITGIYLMLTGTGNKEESKASEHIYSPVPGDVYEIITDDNYYTLCKVMKVSGDSVYISFHLDETDTESGLSKLKLSNAFETEIYAFTISQLIERYNEGYILNIDRTGEEPGDFKLIRSGEKNKESDTLKTGKPAVSVSNKEKARPANR